MIETNNYQQVKRVILIEGSANLLVLMAKAIVGFSTGSLAKKVVVYTQSV